MEARTTSDIAAQLEADLAQYPDERAQILVEAAEAWRRAGDDDLLFDLDRA